MATTPTADRAQDIRPVDDSAPKGTGWVTFAGIMLFIVGAMNVIYGIAAIDNSQFYAAGTNYLLTDLNTWGWVLLCVGAVQFLAAFGVWSGSELARWFGVACASVNALVQMSFISAAPLASVSLLGLDVLIIFALVTYGGRQSREAV